MRPIIIGKKVRRIRWEDCMGAYTYHETLRETFRTLLPPPESGPFARRGYPPAKSDKEGNDASFVPS